MSEDGSSGANASDNEGITRRRVLLAGGTSLAAIGGGRALYNTTLGYGQFGRGTNLEAQDLPSVVTEHLSPRYDEEIEGTQVQADGNAVFVGETDWLTFDEGTSREAAELDAEFGLDDRLRSLFDDLSAFHAGEYTFEFHQPSGFFDRFDDGEPRREVVTAIRRYADRTVDPAIVEQFTGTDPSDVAELVAGLTEGFRKHTSYDVPRYLAGSIEDNVIFGAADLREHFEDDVTFEALLESEGTGIFCWELVYRSIEGFQALRPTRQSIPVAACYVSDRRHKHAFTGLLSALRVDGELRLPMTFLDYTHSTLYDDVRVTRILGEGLAAYDDGHRADEVYW
ncbi:MAG: hypothetical protein ACQET5_02280 [Halobacteriota archaeon]|uniref:hypothetical protein n=1 Tax=Natronomonas sp. TaxID=2184060 RepID=UPI00397722C8